MAIDVSTLTPFERQLRGNVRNFLCGARNRQEIVRELEISRERKDALRERFVQEWLDEYDAENQTK